MNQIVLLVAPAESTFLTDRCYDEGVKTRPQNGNEMNPVVISAIIAAASFTLTIFSAIYLNQRHVDKLIEQLEKRFEARFTGTEARIFGLEQTMNARFDSVDKRLSGVESRLDRIEQILFKPVLPGA